MGAIEELLGSESQHGSMETSDARGISFDFDYGLLNELGLYFAQVFGTCSRTNLKKEFYVVLGVKSDTYGPVDAKRQLMQLLIVIVRQWDDFSTGVEHVVSSSEFDPSPVAEYIKARASVAMMAARIRARHGSRPWPHTLALSSAAREAADAENKNE